MTAPDKIWVNADDNTDGCCPVETDLDDVGKFFDVGQAVEYTRSDLIAALAVGVKPLVWEPPVGGFRTARLPFGGKIEIMWDRSPRDGEHYVLHPGTLERQIFPTLKVAQAVAQALYDTAILSALHPASPLGAVAALVEDLRELREVVLHISGKDTLDRELIRAALTRIDAASHRSRGRGSDGNDLC